MTAKKKIVVASLATLATASLFSLTACSSSNGHPASVGTTSKVPTAIASHAQSPAPKITTDTAPGGSHLAAALGAKPEIGVGADEATQVHMQFTNNTHETLNLTASSRGGDNAHWETQPPTSLAPGDSGFASSYSSGNAQISLTYTGATDNAVITLTAETPLVGSNTASGSSSTTSYTVSASAGSGYNPTDKFSILPGSTFDYTGKAETYTVPAGVTSLNVTAVGGNGGYNGAEDDMHHPTGAKITGTLAVTPGEVLTIGVGGNGGDDYNDLLGGWGLSLGSSSFRGGNGYVVPTPITTAVGGGGASVILDAQNKPIVVAGGGGGDGWYPGLGADCMGGRAGYNGSLIGEGGHPKPEGGTGGGNAMYQGQDTTTNSATTGGAGGGGYNGGAAGISPGYGGGAGSSYDAGLQNPAVTTGANGTLDNPPTAEIILTANGS
jgi:hypothetical protein